MLRCFIFKIIINMVALKSTIFVFVFYLELSIPCCFFSFSPSSFCIIFSTPFYLQYWFISYTSLLLFFGCSRVQNMHIDWPHYTFKYCYTTQGIMWKRHKKVYYHFTFPILCAIIVIHFTSIYGLNPTNHILFALNSKLYFKYILKWEERKSFIYPYIHCCRHSLFLCLDPYFHLVFSFCLNNFF